MNIGLFSFSLRMNKGEEASREAGNKLEEYKVK